MNIEQHLIFIKGKDKTEQIQSCKFINDRWQVIYHQSSKPYMYHDTSVEYYENPDIIQHQNSIVYRDNQPLSRIEKILDFGQYIRIIFNNQYTKVYHHTDIMIEQTCLNNKDAYKCFAYLKELATYIDKMSKDSKDILSKQYTKLTTISPQSVLAAYLEKKPLKEEPSQIQPIFPFGFNLSQKGATEKALSKQVSVIEGPPGTGKTQTILNIIANAIVENKTVAVVSNNNSATANVLEKLQKYEVDFIAAYLGNSENKQKFFIEQKNTYPNMSNCVLSHADFEAIQQKLVQSHQQLNDMLSSKNRLAQFKTEFGYFDKYYTQTNQNDLQLRTIFKVDADKILSMLLDYERRIEKGKIAFSGKMYNLFVHGILNFAFYNNSPEAVVGFLQKMYYDKKIQEISQEINVLSNKLGSYNFDNAMKEYSQTSMKLFKARLAQRYKNTKKRIVFSDDALRKNFQNFIQEYPVILSTTHSLRSCAIENYLFDYVIIDEASQVDLVTGALALSCAKKAVIVGDVKQLPNVVPGEMEKASKRIFESFKLDNAYHYACHSLLSSIITMYPDIPKTLLKEHYRCHPKIIGFCNQKFYNNELIVLTNEQDNDKPLILYKTAKGNHARGKFNQRQIDVVFEEIIPQQNIDEATQSVGIISPYRLQTEQLQKVIGTRNIEADTVHKYQGREKDIIILTTVANEIAVNDFVDDPNLINVAVSRAVDKLIVVISDGSDKRHGTNIGDLVRYIQYNNFEIVESQIYSVFDLLYSSYSKKLLAMMKKTKNVSKYKSENLMHTVIEKVLSEPALQSLSSVMHQPLRMLIKDPNKLSDDEYRYAMNILTHTDFVIFNKLDKMPILVVEVDGYAYHANNPKQLERDKMKDNILQKYDIPILRVKTNESGEEIKLRQKLLEILRM